MPKEIKQFTSEIKSVDEENLIIEHFISTEQEDRSKDIMLADGMVINGKVVVLKEHGMGSMAGEPIAKPLSITTGVNEKGVKGIIAKTQYFPDEEGKRLFLKAKDGYMPNFSIGFIPLISSPKSNGGRLVKKWEIVEYSQVAVPDNPGATTKSLDFRIVKKAVVPFKSYDLDPKDAEWSASDETKAADVDDLKKMSTWHDEENTENKSAYKLPHHRADGYNTVFKALSAAVAALNGARGGVGIPEADREKVYNHLVKHYKEFDEEAPELKAIEDIDTKEEGENMEEKNIKSLSGIVSREAAVSAIYETTWQSIEATVYGGLDKKSFKKFLNDEVLPTYAKWYGELFGAVSSENKNEKDLKEIVRKFMVDKLQIKNEAPVEDSADEPASPEEKAVGDNSEPPAAKGLKLVGFQKPEPKKKTLSIDKSLLEGIVHKAVRANLRDEVDRLKGKLS